MEIVKTCTELAFQIETVKKNNNISIGFVPTMGSLHKGHISLLEKSKKENNISIVSIFVNPTQFNNPIDLINYPREIERDIKILQENKCDILFLPSNEEIYPKGENIQSDFNFGNLENVMEGKYRAGHFKGVAMVVNILFNLTKPDKAYFGLKDYQQLLIVKQLTEQFHPNIKIIPCDIVREHDGLAMSSRNTLLTKQQRAKAPIIYEILKTIQSKFNELSIESLKSIVNQTLNSHNDLELEYFEIADAENLQIVNEKEKHQNIRAFIVVKFGNIRLIDNIPLK